VKKPKQFRKWVLNKNVLMKSWPNLKEEWTLLKQGKIYFLELRLIYNKNGQIVMNKSMIDLNLWSNSNLQFSYFLEETQKILYKSLDEYLNKHDLGPIKGAKFIIRVER